MTIDQYKLSQTVVADKSLNNVQGYVLYATYICVEILYVEVDT